jgi:hypothetical protein
MRIPNCRASRPEIPRTGELDDRLAHTGLSIHAELGLDNVAVQARARPDRASVTVGGCF